MPNEMLFSGQAVGEQAAHADHFSTAGGKKRAAGPQANIADIAIIGAGPYGLSLAAHLGESSKRVRTMGLPMQTWRSEMPRDMHLKSEGFASSLYDPRGEFPLSRYCREQGIAYGDVGVPVPRQVFTEYGETFARRYVPELEERVVEHIEPVAGGFTVELADGEKFQSRRVVCAVGISHYRHISAPFAALPAELVSHSSSHTEFSRFRGKRVAVIGSGASATDCAALLAAAGAETHLVTRRSAVAFHEPPRARSLKDRIKAPRSTIGMSWEGVFFARAPLAFHALPASLRVEKVRTFAGPAACWFVRDQIEAQVTVHHDSQVRAVTPRNGHAVLQFGDASQPPLEVEHVIAATGYRVDLDRLRFLGDALKRRLTTVGGAPQLSRNFESSVPGLYFVGPSAANSFGPVQRFACGAEFAARRLGRHLANA